MREKLPSLVILKWCGECVTIRTLAEIRPCRCHFRLNFVVIGFTSRNGIKDELVYRKMRLHFLFCNLLEEDHAVKLREVLIRIVRMKYDRNTSCVT